MGTQPRLSRTRSDSIALELLVPSAAPCLVSPRADQGDIGHEGPTSTEVERRLKWASVFDAGSGDFHILKLDRAMLKWVDTIVSIDARSDTRQDTLWDDRYRVRT